MIEQRVHWGEAEIVMCASQPQSAEVLAVLCSFKAAQEKRVRQYVHFNHSFAEFLRSKDEAPYRCVQEILSASVVQAMSELCSLG